MTTSFAHPDELLEAVGADLGAGEWITIDQARIRMFAEATGDHQWIHVDPERAAAGPFGTTIAHGYLTLSLLPALAEGLLEVGRLAMAVNYGLERVRFLQPVPAGARVRASAVITGAERTPLGVRLAQRVTVAIEGSEKPALVADTLAVFAALPA
ncbi:MaoC family dehydratase [Protaetiibacter mangrovi]|uniref:MaoC family dehydratase n=1 Tax=Protaetiibacter mangrovi TaxID=2970926 RepID=A0ABT1ZFQ1_9MICO|nr:MaoC family dehydratase [Protaetiibacter mangrovi]MCS0499538.1 MaoC family dehydratase [Protaetiibacter mangrovi]TPW97920.1 MaoC family dehydratase [Schumannella luteola]